MPKLSRLAGSTSHILTVFASDSSSTTGAGLAGLAYNTSGLTCYYKRNTASAAVAVTLADIATLGTYTSGGFKAVDGTNMPGVYEFHPPDAAYAAGAKSVVFMLRGATNLAPLLVEVELTATDNQAAAGVAAAGLAAIADVALSRDVSNVEATAPEHSLATLILATTEWAITGSTWVIYRSNGSTVHATKPLTTSAGADPIVGVT